MPEQWIDDHVGDEVRPRPGFQSELGARLHGEWQGEMMAMTPVGGSPRLGRPPRWTRIAGWTAAAAVVLVAVVAIVVVRNDREGEPAAPPIDTLGTVPGASVTAPASTSPTTQGGITGVPVTTGPPTPTLPPTTTPATLAPATSSSPTTVAPTSVPPTTPSPPAVASTQDEQTVLGYLGALADGRWTDAAKLLGEGGLEYEARPDMRPLFGADGTMPSLADALAAWCAAGGLCQRPAAIDTVNRRQVATFVVDGITRPSVFIGGTFEGSPLVIGLPVRLPAGVDVGATVACDTSVERNEFADLDGDGWDEVLTLQRSSGGYRLTACGTTLVVAPLDPVASDGRGDPSIDVFDANGDGRDEVLVTEFVDDVLDGAVYRFEGGALVATGQHVMNRASLGGSQGESFGCIDGPTNGGRHLVQYTYGYVGGTDLSNSGALTYTQTVLLPDGSTGASTTGTFTLPAQSTEAFHLIADWCGAMPVQTG